MQQPVDAVIGLGVADQWLDGLAPLEPAFYRGLRDWCLPRWITSTAGEFFVHAPRSPGPRWPSCGLPGKLLICAGSQGERCS